MQRKHFVKLYYLDGYVCLEFGVVDSLLINCCVVDPFLIHKMVDNTEF